MIRPESIGIVAPDGATLSGQVDSVSFIGDRQRVDRSAAPPPRPITVDAPNTLDVKVGDRVGLVVDPPRSACCPGDAP